MTEVLVACAVLVLIVGAVYNLLIFGEKSWEATSEGSEAQLNGRLAMERLMRDLRGAREPADESEVIPLADPGEITFYANIDPDPDPERVRYFVTNKVLARGVIEYDQAQGYGGPETEEKIAKNVEVFSLRYADLNSSSLTQPLSQSTRANIRMITVYLEADVDPDKGPPPVGLKSVARLRNLSFAD